MSETFEIWKPQFEGHAPTYWVNGMDWNTGGQPPKIVFFDPAWSCLGSYSVPTEAVRGTEKDLDQ